MFRGNPIYKKEVRTGMRVAKAAAFIMGFNTILAVFALVILYNSLSGVRSMGALNYNKLIELYSVMAYIEFGIIALIVPAITADAIVGERERKTLDVMLASKVSTVTIIWGKMFAHMQIIVCVCISSLPVLSLVFIYGGIRLSYLLMLIFTVICTGFYFGSIGILSSCVCKKISTSVVMAYVGMAAVVFVTAGISYAVEKLNSDILTNIASYIMLLNPVVTIAELIGSQLENVSYFDVLFFNDILKNNRAILENWTFYGIMVQVAVGTVILFISAWLLNPLKFNMFRRMKKKNGKRKYKKRTR